MSLSLLNSTSSLPIFGSHSSPTHLTRPRSLNTLFKPRTPDPICLSAKCAIAEAKAQEMEARLKEELAVAMEEVEKLKTAVDERDQTIDQLTTMDEEDELDDGAQV